MPPTMFSTVLLLAASCCFSCSLASFDLGKQDLMVAKLGGPGETLVHSYSLQPVSPYVALFKLGHIGNLWAEVAVAATQDHFRLITVAVEVDTGRGPEDDYSRLDAVFSDSADKVAPFFNVSKKWKDSEEPALELGSKQKGCCKLAANFVADQEFNLATMVFWFEPEDKDREWALRKDTAHSLVLTASPSSIPTRQLPSEAGFHAAQTASSARTAHPGPPLGNWSGREDWGDCPEIRVSTTVEGQPGFAWDRDLRAIMEFKHLNALVAKKHAMKKARDLQAIVQQNHKQAKKRAMQATLWKVGAVGAVICCLCLLGCVWYWCFCRRRGGDEGSGDGSSLTLIESSGVELEPSSGVERDVAQRPSL